MKTLLKIVLLFRLSHCTLSPKRPITSFIKVINDQIIRPPYESRNFRALELKNGLKVMLIQDPLLQESAASAIVDVGSMNDPPEQQGLAHLCQHMLLSASEKFPLDNNFNTFVKSNGGQWNGVTKVDRTEYFFTIYSARLVDALERFSQFFIAPLFTEKALDRELSLMDEEFSLKSRTLAQPIESILRQLSLPNHNFTKFVFGNRRSLTEKLLNDQILEMRRKKKKDKKPNVNATSMEIFRKLRQNLQKFFADFYSPNRISLVIVHNDSLDFMADKIIDFFGAMRKSNQGPAIYDTNPFEIQDLGFVAKIYSPFVHGHYMRFVFPLPNYNLSLESSGFIPYATKLFSDQRPGGLFHELKQNGFLRFLNVRFQILARSFGFLKVDMQLTPSGMERWRHVLRIFFRFTGFVIGGGVQQLFYEDMKFIESLDYRFKDMESPSGTAMLTNQLLYDRNVSFREPIYLFPRLPKKVDQEKFAALFTGLLQPNNCIITLVSQQYKNETNRIEKWFNTKYRISRLSQNFSLLLQNDQKSRNLFKPFSSNDLIPTRFNLLAKEDKLSTIPALIINNGHLSAWYKQELQYSQPRIVVYVKISSEDQFSDPQRTMAAEIYTKAVIDQWSDSFAYDVKMARYTIGLTCPQSVGSIFFAYGFSQKMPILLGKSVFALLNSDHVTKSAFESAKSRTLRAMEQDSESGLKVWNYYSEYLTTKNIWSREEKMAAAENMTFARFLDIMGNFLPRSHIESFIFGNTNRKEVNQMNEMILGIWNPKNLSKTLKPKRKIARNLIRPILLPEGGEFVFRHNASNFSDDSYVKVLYQNADDSNFTDVVLNEFLCFLLENECYDQLRVKERLGSFVECKSWSHFGTYGLQFTVVGRKPADYLEERIDQFVNRSQLFLKALPNFNTMKELWIAKLRKTPDAEVTLADQFWFEIVNGRYDFDRRRNAIAVLRRLTKANLLSFYQVNSSARVIGNMLYSVFCDIPSDKVKFNLKSSKRRKLSVQIVGSDVAALQKSELKNRPPKRKVVEIRDVRSWKDKLKAFEWPVRELDTF